ncbi:DeoR family transcriptional regulator [Vibrio cyclitrophicus]|uniref:DeoR family transcriptional regulator n=1 Tax=Vibrio cyclitrophicus TaxID=47951 RepID=UPI0009BDBC99|nr:DeoR family transcriptional regulator [Vibrio cyclitrophicus]
MKSHILANRLADITERAYAGQSLSIKDLAEQYQVSTKTIRRDFDRLCAILERCPETGHYHLSISARSQYNEQDLVRLIDDLGLKKSRSTSSRYSLTYPLNRESHLYNVWLE